MSEESAAFDTVFDLCENQHCRIVLGALVHEQRSLTINDLTEAIVKNNHHVPVTEIPEEDMSELQTSLYHLHLPKIESAGLIEYDHERGRVEPTAQLEQVEAPLSVLIEADPSLEPPVRI